MPSRILTSLNASGIPVERTLLCGGIPRLARHPEEVPGCCPGGPGPCGCLGSGQSGGCGPTQGILLYYRVWQGQTFRQVWERPNTNCCCDFVRAFPRRCTEDVVTRNVVQGFIAQRRLVEQVSAGPTGGTRRERVWEDRNGVLTLIGDSTVPWNPGCVCPGPGGPLSQPISMVGYELRTCSRSLAVLQAVVSEQLGQPLLVQEIRTECDFSGNRDGCVTQTCRPCCLPVGVVGAEGGCFEAESEEVCRSFGGWPATDCQSCLRRVLGACCINGQCSLRHMNECAQLGGYFLGHGFQCVGSCPPPPTGACCLPDGTCTQTTNASCIAAGGVYHGNGVGCGAVPGGCVPVSGRCCYPTGCLITPGRTICEATGGVYGGDGTNCAGDPCGLGACCTPAGVCQTVTELGCGQLFGTFYGAGSSCEGRVCTGCCCVQGSGQQASLAECQSLGGTWHGAGSICVVQPRGGRSGARGGIDTTGQIDCSNPAPGRGAGAIRVATGAEVVAFGRGGGALTGGCGPGCGGGL